LLWQPACSGCRHLVVNVEEATIGKLKAIDMSDDTVYELAGGEIAIWLDDTRSILVEVRETHPGPVEVAEH
jgi:hypothetical protein